MKNVKKRSIKMLAFFLSIVIAVVSLPMSAIAIAFENGQEGLESTVTILDEPVELIDERTADTKRFRMEDGSFVVAQYDTTVHYLDENGRWQDIDNRLTADGSEISTSNAKIKFAKKTTGNGNLFALHDGNRKITLSLNGANKKVEGQITNFETEFGEDATKLEKMTTLDRVSASVKYENILENTDLEYVVHGLNIKENIIVKAKGDSYVYSFTMALNQLSAQKTSKGEIEILDSATNEVVYLIPAPIMWDASGVTSHAAEYTLTDLGNGKYDLTVTADPSWMNDSSRTYPVTIDPAIYKSAASDVIDLQVSGMSAGLNDEGSTSFYFGSDSYIYWGLKSLPVLSPSAVITKAKFQATCYNPSYLQGYVGVYEVLTDWDSDLTYQEMDDAYMDGVEVPGERSSVYTDFAYISELGTLESPEGVAYYWNVTPLVKKWYNGANYGLSLGVVSGTSFNGEVQFYASESGTRRPSLTIEYRDQKGLEDYWSYSSQSVGFAGSTSINHANGNLTLAIPMVSSFDGLMPFTPTLVYNSAMANKELVYQSGSAGYRIDVPYTSATMPTGFQLNVQETLLKKSYVDASGVTKSLFTWNDSDGTEHYFIMKSGETSCKDEDGLHLTLETTNSGTTYTITDDNDNVRTFTQMTSPNSDVLGAWYLSSIADKNGNKLTFVGSTTTPAQITSVKLQAANSATVEQLKFAYNSEGRLYAVWNATSDEGVVLRYTAIGTVRRLTQLLRVHSAGDLTESNLSTFYSSGSTTSTSGITVDGVANYTYNTAGQITKVRNELSRYELNYQYESGKVVSVQEKAGLTSSLTNGQKIALNYGTDHTTVQTSGTDDIFGSSDDLLTTYLFDYAGRCINSYTTDINRTTLYGSASGEYVSDNENAKNSLKTVAQTTHRSSNYLVNGGFENGLTTWSSTLVTANDPGDDAPHGYEGNRCADFVVGSGTGYLSQTVQLDSGEYVLSMYYKYTYNDRITSKAAIKVMQGSTVCAKESIPLEKSREAQAYSYISVPFTVPASSSKTTYTIRIELTNALSDYAYMSVDNVMLAKSIGASEFDMIQMGHFESSNTSVTPLSKWSGSTSKASVVTSPTDAGLFGKVLRLTGGIGGTETTVSQVVYEATETMRTLYRDWNPTYYKPGGKVLYNLSGWAKAVSGSGYGANSTFKARVSVEYYTQTSSATVIQTENWEYDFNRELNDWQYFNVTIPVNTNYRLVSKITVSLHYGNQPNVAYFDNLSLVCNSDRSAAYEYNEDGYVISAASGKNETQYSYNDDNDVIRSLSPDGMLTEYTYDAKGRVITERVKYWNGSLYNCPAVDDTSSWNTSSAKLLTTTTYTYNTLGSLTKTVVTDSTGTKLVTESTYNTSGSLIGIKTEEIDARGQYTYYFYDLYNGRLLAVIYPDETGLCYSYDGIGNLTLVQPASYSTGDYYEQNGASVGYTYDTLNRLSRIQTESTSYTLSYDVFGNTTQIKAGSNTLASYSYNANNGKLSVLTYGNGLKVKYVYDELDRISEIRHNMGSGGAYQTVYSYQYTADGQLASIKDHTSNRITVYSYDPSGKLIGSYEYLSTENLSRYHAHFVYDELSRLTNVYQTVNYKVGNTGSAEDEIHAQYTYNSAGRLDESVYTAGGYSSGSFLTYDDLGRLQQKNIVLTTSSVNSFYVSASYTYATASGRGTTPLVESYTSTVEDDYTGVLSSTIYRYSYDANGNITAIRDASNAVIAQYTYDSLGQLTQEINVPLNRKFVWTYDDAGNILSKKTYNKSSGALIETKNYTYSTGSWGDLLTSVGNTEIQYDSIGNPTMWGREEDGIWYDGAILEWQGRQLKCFQPFRENDDGSGDMDYPIYFTYNADGIRTEKDWDGYNHEYILNGSQIVGEWIYNQTILILYIYDETGAPIGMKMRTNTMNPGEFDEYFFEKNLQGDIVAVYNMDGEKIGTYTYDAWGNFTVTLTSGNTTAENNIVNTYNPFRYRGYYYDVETGLYYLQSRYYNPAWGRFINADAYVSTGQGLLGNNMFAYCLNNPVSGVDPQGDITVSKGITLSFGGFGAGYTVSMFRSDDGHGRGAIQWSYSVPKNENTNNVELGVNVGIGVFAQITTLDSIDNLNGESTAVGVAAVAYGVDNVFNKDKEFVGRQASASIGLPAASVHVNKTHTQTLISFDSMFKWLKEIFT